MSNSENSGCLSIFAIIIPIASWIWTGTLAWDWIEPENFWGAIKFIFAWSVLGYIAQLISGFIIVWLANIME